VTPADSRWSRKTFDTLSSSACPDGEHLDAGLPASVAVTTAEGYQGTPTACGATVEPWGG
jgi:hypothetical protein